MKQYQKLLKLVLKKGSLHANRTGVDAISYFGTQTRYDLTKGFPLLTTKKVAYNAIIHELLWFLQGSTNIKYLVDNNVKIWNEWPYENYKKSKFYQNETMDEFVNKIKTNNEFAQQWGELGPVYGKQWRNFNGVDQIKNLIHDLKNNRYSRRLIVSAWNPAENGKMLLPPCHAFFQFYVNDKNELSCQLYQRSADLFLGVPFNIASYSLPTLLVAQVCDLKPKEFIHTIGVAHIYVNHLNQVKKQIKRRPKQLCQVILNPKIKDLLKFKFNDIEIKNYQHHGILKAKVAV